MRKIGLEVLSINHSAIALYEKLGFKKEGTKIGEYFLGGQYLDVLIFGLQRKDWKIEIPAAANRLIAVAQADGLSNKLPIAIIDRGGDSAVSSRILFIPYPALLPAIIFRHLSFIREIEGSVDIDISGNMSRNYPSRTKGTRLLLHSNASNCKG